MQIEKQKLKSPKIITSNDFNIQRSERSLAQLSLHLAGLFVLGQFFAGHSSITVCLLSSDESQTFVKIVTTSPLAKAGQLLTICFRYQIGHYTDENINITNNVLFAYQMFHDESIAVQALSRPPLPHPLINTFCLSLSSTF